MAQNQVHLTCGTRFFIEDVAGSGTMIEIEDVTTFGGEIGQNGTFLESTTITECSKSYIAGLSDAPDMSISFLYSPTTNQSNFRDAGLSGDKRQARIVFADGGAGGVVTADFNLAMAGFTLGDPAPDTIITGTVMGKADGFVWS